ncbi:uncharacterized protein LOC133304036 isoform X2 [Gastrolobium bilobum]|uniref:uncharacterized protein LOC133304036 isoform X2 n=1 Tax=Gastrolobium bilobum TaxID=150636 RepID=UPI002AB19B12|nr:uncharacterized protein LOC133304036 isoform X2 [Gastrolobium bilobum]
MASLWFLKLALKCVDHFAWPLLALGYPLCASVQAIETDSHAETRDLISYWILLSLIYLFEYAFLRLLQWFQFWPYLKLMIIFWLIIPDFGRASYVYNNLFGSQRYIKENGIEALEKLIADKANGKALQTEHKDIKDSTTNKLDVEETNVIRTTYMKEMQQTNGKKLQTEHKDIKDLEVIEKKEIPTGKQDIPVMPNLAPSQNASSTMMETKGIATGKDSAGGELLQSSTHKEVQKEWTCAVCLVTTTSEKTLNFHLHGKKHRATCEALKAKNQPVPQKMKTDQSKKESKQKNINNQLNSKTTNGESTVNNGLKGKTVMHHSKVQEQQKNVGEPVRMNHSILRCEVCNVNCTSELDMASHLKGRKHMAQIKI